MRIAVTGALGHIGSRLIREIPEAFPAAEIVLVDNLVTQRYSSLFSLPSAGKYRFIEADIVTSDLEPIFSGADAVVHLAALTDPAESFRKREEVARVNTEGTRRVARVCLKSKCPILFASTTSVYGETSLSPYAESKLEAERLLQRMGVEEGLRFVICRFGTIFGVSPGMRFSTAVNKFCWQAVMGRPLSVWRTAWTQMRPYLELGDACRTVQIILQRRLFDGGIYNVLTTHAAVSDVVRILSGLLPEVRVEWVDAEGMNLLSYRLSSDPLKSLGFEFHGDLEKGIREIVGLIRSANFHCDAPIHEEPFHKPLVIPAKAGILEET